LEDNETISSIMAKLTYYNGRYVEGDYENAFIDYFEAVGWQYMAGGRLARRSGAEVIHEDDLKAFLCKSHADYTAADIQKVVDNVRLVGAETQFATLHKVYTWMTDGMQITTERGTTDTVALIDYAEPRRNIFRVVNQLEVEYTNNGEVKNRRPDVLLYVNGLPVCIIELKDPTNEQATIHDAYEQITVRYWRDIPHLLHYTPLAVISDGVKSRLGTVRTPYEHFYAWRRINNEDKVSTAPFEELQAMVLGVFEPTRFLEIFRDYILFRDNKYNDDESEIVCRYPQFFAARLLRESIIKSVTEKSGKGGTYFGATGCGKTYTMAMLARQLSMRCGDTLGSPTVVMIVDREDLQKQGIKLFSKLGDYLGLGEVTKIPTRKMLREELNMRESGGFYICTIQKFCDRQDDSIGLINDRANIICFSDEAHRTQLEHAKEIKFSKPDENAGSKEIAYAANSNMRAMLSKPYAKVLREAFPHATFVGFTGTPIAETYQTFGTEIDRYTMDQAVADGLTVPIKYHPRIARVLMDTEQVKLIEQYYKKCSQEGATADDVEASKRAMSSIKIILGEDGRLERLCHDIHDHYVAACNNDPKRVQKAMITCCDRTIAYSLLMKFQQNYPEWFEERKTPADATDVDAETLAKLKPMPTMAMVASVGKNDEEGMYNYLGGVKNDERNATMDEMFKQVHSNFRIVIVVDMWVTGFDVECLTYLYNDKPLQKHTLIQTISRVNRKYEGKEYGLIVDYIGIRRNMLEAMKMYGGSGDTLEPSEDDVNQATSLFREMLEIVKNLFKNYDLRPFINPSTSDTERYELLCKAAEHVFSSNEVLSVAAKDGKQSKKVPFKKYYLQMVKRMKAAHDVCQPSGVLGDEEAALAQCFMAIAGFVRKMNGTSDIDTDTMNAHVATMVEEALKYSEVESILETGEQEDVFGDDFIKKQKFVKVPATRLELLIKLMKKQISNYSETNMVAAKEYQDMLEETIKQYHDRRKKLSAEEAGETQEQTSNEIIQDATKQACDILKAMQADRESFRKMGLTFEEKAFYDILIKQRNEGDFEFGEDKMVDGVLVNGKCKALAKKIKEIIDTKSSYADWLNNQNVRDQLKFDIKICLIKNGYPPQYSPKVFKRVMEQVENYKEHN